MKKLFVFVSQYYLYTTVAPVAEKEPLIMALFKINFDLEAGAGFEPTTSRT
jgi:hypothetical protein